MSKFSFDFKSGSKKSVAVPSKRTMNFVHHESSFNAKVVIPVALVVGVGLSLFLKFGVLDYIHAENAVTQELEQKESQLDDLKNHLSDYDEVAEEYGKYSYAWLNELEIGTVDRLDVLNLLETKVSSKAVIGNIAVNENALTMDILSESLQEASAIAADLETSELVENAFVTSATANEEGDVKVYMSITLSKGEAIDE